MRKFTFMETIIIIFIFIVALAAITLTVLHFVALFKYANTPIQELPTWAWYVLRPMRGR